MPTNDFKISSLTNGESKNQQLVGKIWRGKRPGNSCESQIIDTGYDALNQQLHSHGWPRGITTELGLSQPGIGELRLLIPAMRKLQQLPSKPCSVIWVAPPFLPFATALIREQIDIQQLTVVQTNTIQDTLWATEQALQAECCAAVFCWTGTYNLSNRELRRLQLAAEKTTTWNILFRHSDCLKQSSTAGLRIHLQTNSLSQLNLHILKQPQGWGGQRCSLSLHPHYENWQRLPVSLLPNQNRSQTPTLPERIELAGSIQHKQASVTVLTSLAALNGVH